MKKSAGAETGLLCDSGLTLVMRYLDASRERVVCATLRCDAAVMMRRLPPSKHHSTPPRALLSASSTITMTCPHSHHSGDPTTQPRHVTSHRVISASVRLVRLVPEQRVAKNKKNKGGGETSDDRVSSPCGRRAHAGVCGERRCSADQSDRDEQEHHVLENRM